MPAARALDPASAWTSGPRARRRDLSRILLSPDRLVRPREGPESNPISPAGIAGDLDTGFGISPRRAAVTPDASQVSIGSIRTTLARGQVRIVDTGDTGIVWLIDFRLVLFRLSRRAGRLGSSSERNRAQTGKHYRESDNREKRRAVLGPQGHSSRSGKDGGSPNEHVVSRNVAIPDTVEAHSGERAVHEKDAPCGSIQKRESELPLGSPG